jgi:prepilin-type processing-associated H-X9-DG protein
MLLLRNALARFGLWKIIGAVVVASLGLAALIFPALATTNCGSTSIECLSHVRHIASAMSIYFEDFDDRVPLETWNDDLLPYTKNRDLYDCYEGSTNTPSYGYAMNLAVVGLNVKTVKVPAETVMLFDTEARAENVVTNLAGMSFSRHKGRCSVAFMDTHARFLSPGEKLTSQRPAE